MPSFSLNDSNNKQVYEILYFLLIQNFEYDQNIEQTVSLHGVFDRMFQLSCLVNHQKLEVSFVGKSMHLRRKFSYYHIVVHFAGFLYYGYKRI